MALGRQLIVDNKARNDGHSLMLTVNSAHVINPSLYKSTGFDPVKGSGATVD